VSAVAVPGPRPRRRWIWVAVAVATTAVIVLPVRQFLLRPGIDQHQVSPVTVYRQRITALQVTAPGGAVTISAGGPGQVTLSSTLRWVLRRPAIRSAWHGQVLRVTATCPQLDPGCQTSLVLHVPAGVEVRADVGAGSIAAAGLTGPLHLAATSGTVTLAYVSGPVWASATSGAVSGYTGLNSRQVDAAVTSGSLELALSRAPQRLTISVGSGAGAVTVPPGTHYRMAARSGLGLLRVAAGLGNSHSAGVITAEVGMGTLGISYPGGTG
jgi:hypothetical protein